MLNSEFIILNCFTVLPNISVITKALPPLLPANVTCKLVMAGLG